VRDPVNAVRLCEFYMFIDFVANCRLLVIVSY